MDKSLTLIQYYPSLNVVNARDYNLHVYSDQSKPLAPGICSLINSSDFILFSLTFDKIRAIAWL